ncbi:MAG: pentapeptide repeat-containing protein [Nostocaceae cyanobacterium]|nr:pentapeptide repeat-containing protein [Nostocaceae cyanobacterium]
MSIDFSNQNLRNRSFQGQNLDEANFSNGDIRGCNFNYASLRGANFQGVKAGQNIKDLLLVLLLVIIVVIVGFHAIFQMIFSIITRTPEDPLWGFALALFISLGISGMILPITYDLNTYFNILSQTSIWKRIITSLSAGASGALMGFYYGGTAAGGENAQVAIFSAFVAAIVMSGGSFYLIKGIFPIGINTITTISAYGFTFLLLAKAAVYLSTSNLIPGIVLGLLSVLSIKLTFTCLTILFQKILTYRTTSFCGADLTNAIFDNAQISNSDFTGAKGCIPVLNHF